MSGQTWHYSTSAGGHQGLIYDDTGKSVAVSYDPKDAPVLAAAPRMLNALEQILSMENGDLNDMDLGVIRELVNDAKGQS